MNAGHCEVLDVAHGKKDVGFTCKTLILILFLRMMPWLLFGQCMIKAIKSGQPSLFSMSNILSKRYCSTYFK